MMPVPGKKRATYEDLHTLPDNVTGEIVCGDLVAAPRPSPRHAHAASLLGGRIIDRFGWGGGGGGGGWVILFEPELKLGENILVPDLAGWRKERLPVLPEEQNWISIPPDWVCELLSPSTSHTDKARKMPIYAEFGVAHVWHVDPVLKTLDIFALESSRWVLLSSHGQDDKVRAEPFDEIEIDLARLWS